jgi:hypothetical protein
MTHYNVSRSLRRMLGEHRTREVWRHWLINRCRYHIQCALYP